MSLKITPGEWGEPYYDDNDGDRGWWIHNGEKGAAEHAICVMFTGNPNAEEDAHFIREAGTVANETGLMPRELLAQRDDLLAMLSETVALYGQTGGPWNIPSDPGGWLERARSAIARVRGGS